MNNINFLPKNYDPLRDLINFSEIYIFIPSLFVAVICGGGMLLAKLKSISLTKRRKYFLVIPFTVGISLMLTHMALGGYQYWRSHQKVGNSTNVAELKPVRPDGVHAYD